MNLTHSLSPLPLKPLTTAFACRSFSVGMDHSQLTFMIIRIVRMHFRPEGVSEFLRIFEDNKIAIRNFEGCTHLELLKDADNSFIYTTLSHWENPESLERYRKSEIFSSIWGRVRRLFAERTQAFSLVKFIEV